MKIVNFKGHIIKIENGEPYQTNEIYEDNITEFTQWQKINTRYITDEFKHFLKDNNIKL